MILAAMLSGCTSGGSVAEDEPDPARTGWPPAPPSAEPTVVRTLEHFKLLTHCGVTETRVGKHYYRATPPLFSRDKLGPPRGWDNPFQVGEIAVYTDGTAHFTAGKDLGAAFVVRLGAERFLHGCA